MSIIFCPRCQQQIDSDLVEIFEIEDEVICLDCLEDWEENSGIAFSIRNGHTPPNLQN